MKRLYILLPLLLALTACDNSKSKQAPTPQVGLAVTEDAAMIDMVTKSVTPVSKKPDAFKLTNLTKCPVKDSKDAFVIDGTYAYRQDNGKIGDDQSFIADYKANDAALSNIETEEQYIEKAKAEKKQPLDASMAYMDQFVKRKSAVNETACVDVTIKNDEKK